MIGFLYFVAVLIFISIVVLQINQKKIIGMAGELWVKGELSKLPSDYLVINDLMVKVEDRTSQIDHVVISKYGIFVIETKQINGYIRGNDYDKNWTVYAGDKSYPLYNPVHQNYGHVQALKNILDLDEKVFIPIVCISSQAKLRIKSKQVVPIYNLLIRIKKYKQEILPEYVDIYKTLEFINMTSKDSREAHVDRVKETRKEKQRKELERLEEKALQKVETIDNNICPRCGGNLVMRNGKYSKFFGCSNYPKCKYTKQI